MGYDIRFKAKVEGVDYWVKVSSSRVIFPKSKREALEKNDRFFVDGRCKLWTLC